jgi:integrase
MESLVCTHFSLTFHSEFSTVTILTDAFLKSPKRTPGQFFYDAHNLALRTGKKRHTWQIKTRTSAETIGYFPAMGIAEARAIAAERAERREHGLPINAAPVAKPGVVLTLEGLMDRYEQARRKDELKTLAQGMRVLRNGFKDYLKLDMASFTKQDMRAAHSAMSDGGRTVNGNRFLAYASAMFRWAIFEDLIDTNYSQFVKRAKEKARERVLSMDELAAVWLATERLDARQDLGTVSRQAYLRMVRFLMLTGQRLADAADVKHGHIVAGQWTQTENKSSRRHTLRLSAAALNEVGMGRHPLDRVFASKSGERLNNFERRIDEVRAESGIADWTHHDLRRSMVTHLAEAGVPLEVTEALLNHKLGGVAGVYHHAKHEGPKRDALKLWGELVATAVGKVRKAA